MLGQAPQDPQGVPEASGAVVAALQDLGWIDVTALAVLGTFCILGVFKGFVWQISRIAILGAAYVLAGRFGADLGAWLHHAFGTPTAELDAVAPATTLYVAYVLIFLLVLIALSLLALLLQALVRKAGLTFFDRLGGGAIGIATGACVVFFLLAVVHMFGQRTHVAAAAAESHSLRLSKQAQEALGPVVPDEVRSVFALPPLRPAPAGPGETGNRDRAQDAPTATPGGR